MLELRGEGMTNQKRFNNEHTKSANRSTYSTQVKKLIESSSELRTVY